MTTGTNVETKGSLVTSSEPSSTQDVNDLNKESDDQIAKCSCGYDRHHHWVSQERKYSSWNGFWVMVMGVSARPLRIDFRCRRCKEKFDFITNPEELKRYL
jgi:hypothetical protein